jgi:hypothetical protein
MANVNPKLSANQNNSLMLKKNIIFKHIEVYNTMTVGKRKPRFLLGFSFLNPYDLLTLSVLFILQINIDGHLSKCLGMIRSARNLKSGS